MKVLRVRDTSADRPAVSFHGQVTVVRGMDPLRRAWLVETLGALAAERLDGVEGEIEAHGIVFSLSADTLTTLDLTSSVPSALTAADLPGHDPRVAEAVAAKDRALIQRRDLTSQITKQRGLLGDAVTERSEALAAIEEIKRGDGAARQANAAADAARSRLDAEVASAAEERERNGHALSAAVLARDVAGEARAAAAERLERERERHRIAMQAATAAAAAVEQARPLVANDPTEALIAARADLAAAEAAAGDADPEQTDGPLVRKLTALEHRQAEVVRLKEAIGDDATTGVSSALDVVTGANGDAAPVVAALALADTWRDLHQQIDALDAGVSDAEVDAERRVARARQDLAEAELDFNQPVLTPEQIAKVEAAHAAVLEAQDRTESRFGGGRVRKRLEDARSEERRVLERLGFSTYADYMMSSSSRGMGPANRSLLDVARNNVKAAEDHLAAIPGASERARRRVELLQRRDAVAPRVAALLGHEPTGPEAEEELRSVREAPTDDQAALGELAAELEKVGVAVGPAPYQREDLVLLARFYQSEQESADERRVEVDQALKALDRAIGTLRRAHERGQTEVPDLGELPELAQVSDAPLSDDASDDATLREARWAKVEAARTAVSEAEAAVARHRDATDSLAGIEEAFARSTVEEEQAGAAVAAAEADLALANGPAFDDAVNTALEAEQALARSTLREQEAVAARAAHDEADPTSGILGDAQARLAAAERAVTEAAAKEQTIAATLAEVDAAYADASAAEEHALAAVEGLDRPKLVDDIEWSLMSTLASHRSVGLGGSFPLVLDDPFVALDDDELVSVLDRISRLADAVQVVLVTDREAAVAWATEVGSERALVQAG